MVKKYTEVPTSSITQKNHNQSDPRNASANSGCLYIVATPIGNLGDITQRAIETLKKVDRICAEDTRNTRKLLTHFGIQGELQALHDHNETQKISTVQNWLDGGENIALVSDAGTPLISDPGYHLVNELSTMGYNVIPIPGVSAIIAALSVAGLPTDRFTFEGFLPAKSLAKKTILQQLKNEPRTQIYYESSHRIIATISTMKEVFGGQRKVVLARELTKMFEQVYRGTLLELEGWIVADLMHQKGEFVLMIKGCDDPPQDDAFGMSAQELLSILLSELPVKQAAGLAAKITGNKKNELYRLAMQLKESLNNLDEF